MTNRPKSEFRQNWHLRGFRISETICFVNFYLLLLKPTPVTNLQLVMNESSFQPKIALVYSKFFWVKYVLIRVPNLTALVDQILSPKFDKSPRQTYALKSKTNFYTVRLRIFVFGPFPKYFLKIVPRKVDVLLKARREKPIKINEKKKGRKRRRDNNNIVKVPF